MSVIDIRAPGEIVDGRAKPVDIAMVLSVPVVLWILFQLPRAVRLDLSFAYQRPSALTAYTMHFVHLDPWHLLANVTAYLLIVPLTYALAVLADRRRSFHVAFATFLIAFPPVLSVLNLAVPRAGIGFGFSGINMAFFGLLPLMLFEYVRIRYPVSIDFDHAPVLFFGSVSAISFLALPAGRVQTAIVAVAALGALLYLRSLPWTAGTPEMVRSFLRSENAEFALVAATIFALFPLAAFPPDPVGNGTVLNLFSHFLGYCLGFIASFATFRFVDV